MNRINKLFQEKTKDILSVYYTAGYPNLGDTMTIANHLEEAGADMIEIGIPFSDPVADGPTIQESNTIALNNGMTLKVLFDQLGELRQTNSTPVILMGYVNPILQYGLEAFCKTCQQVGVDGLIIPDLPMAEYLNTYRELFEAYDLRNVFLISPQTSDERITEIDTHTDSFIYMVSSAGTTGAKDIFEEKQLNYFKRINSMDLKNPRLIGFGISNNTTFQQATENAQGAIIGSAFIKTLTDSKDLKLDIHQFVKKIKNN